MGTKSYKIGTLAHMLRSFLNLIKISFSLPFWWWVNFHWKRYLTFKGFPYLAAVRYFSLACMKHGYTWDRSKLSSSKKKKLYYNFSYTFTKRKFRSPKASDYHLESNLNLCVINLEIDGYCKTDNRFRVKKQQQQKKKPNTWKTKSGWKEKRSFLFLSIGLSSFF